MSPNGYKILLVDDEKDTLEFIGYNLRKDGYTVFTSNNGQEAVELAKKELPQLIILDVMMPGMDGIEVCDVLRNTPETTNSLIAFLTARGEDYSHVAGFDAGADDYITKPIKPKVLVSRVGALLRRFGSKMELESVIEVSDLNIDKEKYQVTKEGERIELPRKEFELLSLLASRPGKVFNRDEILDKIWGSEVIVGGRTIDVHVRKLREKIGEGYIKTVKGVGYKFEA
ncbi:MAG: response regulator transcription factor [Flavobacteriales bacterium]|nr:response regulator transcription factor [Flavobacteriales bacterium]